MKRQVCQGVDGPCPNEGIKRRQNTAYSDDSQNWVVMCDKCAAYNEEEWAKQWAEYNAGRL